MGCGGSKVDDLPLVIRCRARKEMIKSAMDYRYDLSSSHVAYFRTLNDIGYALSRFVDEELVVSSSSASSPVLTLPSDEGNTNSSISYIHSIDRNNDSHLQLSSSDSESDLHSSSGGHIHIDDDDDDDDSVPGNQRKSPLSSFYPPHNHNHNQTNWNDVDPYATNFAPSPYQFPNAPLYESAWGPYGGIFYSYRGNSNMYYMKKSAPASSTVVHKEERGFQSDYNSNVHENGGFTKHNPTNAPSPPPPPKVSGWDFLNFFEGYENGYQSYGYGYGYGSVVSSPDTSEVREREGIPDLEEETENESHNEEVKLDTKRNKSEGTTSFLPKENIQVNSSKEASQSSGGSSKRVPMPSRNSEATSNSVPSHSIDIEVDTSIRSTISESVGEKKEASVDADEEVESSRLSPRGSLGLQEVFNEIKNEFDLAFGYGKEVDMLLEAGKVPYHPKFAVVKVALSMIMYPFSSTLHPKQSEMSRSQTTKLARSYHLDAVASISLSSTLEKLYTWEKKLYKQVKDEERVRLKYDNMSKKLKDLDARGAEYTKIDAVRASVRRTLTKLDVCIKSIDAINSKIQKVRDEELQPQLSELIYGFVRMWKLIVKCHRKQFQAINSSETWKHTSPGSDNATLELIITWGKHFEDWINAQKSLVNSLNAWLQECIDHDHESGDGNIPFSPGRIGAPPIFTICNDWHNGVKRVSEEHVSTAIRVFASNLRKLLERRDESTPQNRATCQGFLGKWSCDC